MDANVLDHFILATDSIFKQVANQSIKKEKVDFYPDGHRFKVNVATMIGFTGMLKGQFAIAIDESMAVKFASAIMEGTPVNEYNEMAVSGVCEMVNMIGGETLERLSRIGYVCDLTLPTFIRGHDVEMGFTPKIPLFAVEFSCDWGRIQIIMRYELSK